MSYIDNTHFIRAIRYIHNHIDQPITLSAIADDVGLSLSSLKRLFEQAVEQSPACFIRRLRMELALQALQVSDQSILDIAMSAGFDNQSAFARRFKQTFGYTPGQARNVVHIASDLESIELAEPDMIHLVDFALQGVTVTGRYFESAPAAWAELKAGLDSDKSADDMTGMFVGIGHDNPHLGVVAEDQERFSACVSHETNNLGLEKIVIKGGSYARFRYQGKPNCLGLAYHYIHGQWVESVSLEIDHAKPAFVIFDRLPDDLGERYMMIHVPLI